MQNSVEIPELIYRRTEQAAQARGISVKALVSDVLDRELTNEAQPSQSPHRVSLPIIHSDNPGTLDLSNFDFDDLLA